MFMLVSEKMVKVCDLSLSPLHVNVGWVWSNQLNLVSSYCLCFLFCMLRLSISRHVDITDDGGTQSLTSDINAMAMDPRSGIQDEEVHAESKIMICGCTRKKKLQWASRDMMR